MEANTQHTPLESDTRRYIPILEATHILGWKDVRVTKRLIREGVLKARTVGRNTYVSRQSILDF